MTVIVKPDRSPVADLKRPYKTRHNANSAAAGAIELAYRRGYAAGVEDTTKSKRRKRHRGQQNG